MSTVDNGNTYSQDYEFCKRCGRRLKNPERRKIGYGIVCEKKMTIKKTGGLFNATLPASLP